MGAFKASTNYLSLGGIQRNDWYATQVKVYVLLSWDPWH